MNDINKTLEERGKNYGVFADHAAIAQSLKALMSGDWAALQDVLVDQTQLQTALMGKWDVLAFDMQESLHMIAHKIARILNGNPDHIDSWVDIAGYAQLVANRLQGKKDHGEDPVEETRPDRCGNLRCCFCYRPGWDKGKTEASE